MFIQTNRLIITRFTMDMARDVHLNSLDENTRRFVPDEIWETEEEAANTLSFLIDIYESCDGPLVYPVLLKDGTNIGYVQAVPIEKDQWEIGYHIAMGYTCQGYATEAVRAFLPAIMKKLHISMIHGVCLAENIASIRVLEHCRFQKQFEGTGMYQGTEQNILRFLYIL